ncbi:hypothetical protein YC2023_012293 [Brassica napus]
MIRRKALLPPYFELRAQHQAMHSTKALVYQLCSTPSKLYKHVYIASLNSDLKTFTLDLHGLVGMVIQKTSLGYKNLKMTKRLSEKHH